jgi:flagellar biosynthesis protein FlhG
VARALVDRWSFLARGTHEALRRAAGAFLKREIPLSGIVRRDLKVRDAIRHQMPLLTRHPSAAAALDIEEIARSLG